MFFLSNNNYVKNINLLFFHLKNKIVKIIVITNKFNYTINFLKSHDLIKNVL